MNPSISKNLLKSFFLNDLFWTGKKRYLCTFRGVVESQNLIFQIQICRASSVGHGSGSGRFLNSYSTNFCAFSWSGRFYTKTSKFRPHKLLRFDALSSLWTVLSLCRFILPHPHLKGLLSTSLYRVTTIHHVNWFVETFPDRLIP